MTEHIQGHHSEEEILKIDMQRDVRLYRNKLNFVADEIQFYLDLLGSSLIRKTQSNDVDAGYLLKQFEDLKETNEFHLETCLHFQNRLPEMDECDDVQCDYAYLQSYLLLKNKLEKHFYEVRNIKEAAFNFFKKGIEKVMN